MLGFSLVNPLHADYQKNHAFISQKTKKRSRKGKEIIGCGIANDEVRERERKGIRKVPITLGLQNGGSQRP